MGEDAKQEAAEEKKESKPPSPIFDFDFIWAATFSFVCNFLRTGVEGVVIDMAENQVTIRGTVEPEAICNIITKKTKKKVQVMSPLPEPEVEPTPEIVTSLAIEPVTVELNINMHCEACAEQLKRKIFKMRGVQTAVAELSTGKVIVTGTMDANKLVDYVHRRTRKQVKIVPQPEPEPLAEKKELENPGAEEVKHEEEIEEKEEEKPAEDTKKEEGGNDGNNESKEEKGIEEEEVAKKEVVGDENGVVVNVDDESMKKMIYSYYYQPLYVIEPPPQLFSDENPNACCIS
ncbi:Heavy metal-associated isoprenylated plant protein [Vigna angularis]|uniref:Heavy metal-associated isoprenylated plant protein n=1 Tax=Phaseolus angularis TaxID=3914 RepID=A0A8T0KIR7_PHAAN|nr:Heavy metal-associated isoprenylated plant protein [Vigna angularis]